MFGFLFNKKSKSFDKETKKSSNNGSKKSNEEKENNGDYQSPLPPPLSVESNSKAADLDPLGDLAPSNPSTDPMDSSSEKESSSRDIIHQHPINNQELPSDIQNSFNIHDDIPFHDDDENDDQSRKREESPNVNGGNGDGDGDARDTSVDIGTPKHNKQPESTTPVSTSLCGNERPADKMGDQLIDILNCDNKILNPISSSTPPEQPPPPPTQNPTPPPPPPPLTPNLANTKNERDTTESEKNAMMQLDEIRSKLLAKETELSLLQADINMLSVDRENKVVEIEGLSTQNMVLNVEKESAMESVQKLESELQALRQKNSQLADDLLKKSEQVKDVESTTHKSDKTAIDLQVRLKELEAKLKEMEVERDKLAQERDAIEVEREEELRAMQNCLDDAIEAKIKIQNKFERDFEDLRTTNASQEQTLMEDFEWKLRQIEQSSKKKLQDKDRQVEEKLREYKMLEAKELGAEKEQLRQERRLVEEQMKQVTHLKSYEAEVVQLRGLTHEQQKALRAASRQLEHLKLNDKLLQDDLRSLRVSLEKEKTHSQVAQASTQRRLDSQEELLQSKLDKQKNELNAVWEDKCRTECNRLKEDLCKLHAEEKHLAVETMKIQKDQEMSQAKQTWERQKEELFQNISKLKDTISEKESYCHREVERVRTQTDRDGWEMRRQLDKITTAHMEQLEKLKDKHSEEMDILKPKCEEAQARVEELETEVKRCKSVIQDKEKELEVEKEKHQQAAAAAAAAAASAAAAAAATAAAAAASATAAAAAKPTLTPQVPSAGKPVEVLSVKVMPIQSHSDTNDSSSESEFEEDDEDDEDEEGTTEESESDEPEIIKAPKEILANGIDGLRKEVKNLQGSIEKLTSDLTQEAVSNISPSNSTSASTSAAASQSNLSEGASSAATDSSVSDEDEDEDDDDDDDELNE